MVNLDALKMFYVLRIFFLTSFLTFEIGSGVFQSNTKESTVVMPSLFPEFDVDSSKIKYTRVKTFASNSSIEKDPQILLSVGNELYWLTEKSAEIIGVFADTNVKLQHEREPLNIRDIQVNIVLQF